MLSSSKTQGPRLGVLCSACEAKQGFWSHPWQQARGCMLLLIPTLEQSDQRSCRVVSLRCNWLQMCGYSSKAILPLQSDYCCHLLAAISVVYSHVESLLSLFVHTYPTPLQALFGTAAAGTAQKQRLPLRRGSCWRVH